MWLLDIWESGNNRIGVVSVVVVVDATTGIDIPEVRGVRHIRRAQPEVVGRNTQHSEPKQRCIYKT